MRQVINIKTEKDLSELYANKKKGTFNILYTSLWDESCQRLAKKVSEWQEREGDELLYVINSWDTPAAFSMFMIMSAPSLVGITRGKVKVSAEFPTIYQYFEG